MECQVVCPGPAFWEATAMAERVTNTFNNATVHNGGGTQQQTKKPPNNPPKRTGDKGKWSSNERTNERSRMEEKREASTLVM